MEDDKDVSRRYRELGREEPPPGLDARIRAEARSAVETVAAPLVPPTGRRRWYFPVAAAAVIMLAVGVVTQVEREQPQEVVVQEKQKVEEAKPQQPAQTEALAKRPEPRPFAQAPKTRAPAEASTGARSREDFTRDNRARQEPPAAAPATPEMQARRQLEAGEKGASIPEASAEAKLRSDEARKKEEAVQPQRTPAPPQAAGAASNLDALGGSAVSGAMVIAQTPEALLAFIAELRRQGKHDEADKQLEAFRKRYPDYKIPPETLKKVERPR